MINACKKHLDELGFAKPRAVSKPEDVSTGRLYFDLEYTQVAVHLLTEPMSSLCSAILTCSKSSVSERKARCFVL